MPFPLLKQNREGSDTEALEKASHDAGFLVKDLQDALKTAGPVVSLLVLQQIEKATSLKRDIDALRSAISTPDA